MLRSLIVVTTLSLIFTSSFAQETLQLETTLLTEREVAVGLDLPWELHWGPNDNIWVSERSGRILLVEPESGNTRTLLDLNVTGNGGGEPGLLGLTLHPDFENTPLVYVVYNYNSGGIKERLVSYSFDGESLSDETILLDNIPGAQIHNGSRLMITDDLKILMTTGDIGTPGNAQSLGDNIMGKTLRLNMDGSMPDDNPVEGTYIYSYGHRNAQGICTSPNGTIYSTEHGPNHSDEVNILAPGQNYGWPEVTGPCNTSFEQDYCANNETVEPIYAWTAYCIAPNDLVYYDHPAIPEFNNSLLVAILGGIGAQEPRISQLVLSDDGSEVLEEIQYLTTYGRIRDVCVNPNNGAIFFATNGPNYPGSGPNKIIEYRNLDFEEFGVGIEDDVQLLDIYPNPASKQINLTVDESFVQTELQVFSYAGKMVHRQVIDNQSTSVDVNDFANGFYYLSIENKNGKVTRSFVVEH